MTQIFTDHYANVMPERFRLTRRFAAEARWAYRASRALTDKRYQ